MTRKFRFRQVPQFLRQPRNLKLIYQHFAITMTCVLQVTAAFALLSKQEQGPLLHRVQPLFPKGWTYIPIPLKCEMHVNML